MITRRTWMGLTAGAAASALRLNADPIVPRKAPELAVTLNSGERLLLSSLRGKAVVLEFLLTTCPHCQRCSSILQQLYPEYEAKGLQPVGAAINANARTLVPEFTIRLGLKFPVGTAEPSEAYEFLQRDPSKGIIYMPQLVFIDRQGTIRAQRSGEEQWFADEENNMRKQLDELMREPVSVPHAPAAAKGATRK